MRTLLSGLAELPVSDIRKLHPDHTPDSLRAALDRFHVYPHGNCIVHHQFGGEVTQILGRDYADALYTAHLEVPGDMFALANEASRCGRGVVRVKEAAGLFGALGTWGARGLEATTN